MQLCEKSADRQDDLLQVSFRLKKTRLFSTKLVISAIFMFFLRHFHAIYAAVPSRRGKTNHKSLLTRNVRASCFFCILPTISISKVHHLVLIREESLTQRRQHQEDPPEDDE